MTALSILFVTSRFPLPLFSGDRARAFHQLHWLARRGHRVTLVTFADPTCGPAAHAPLERVGVRIITVPFTKRGAAFRLAINAWSDLPLQAALYQSRRARAKIRELAAKEQFDLAHVQLARTVPLVGADLGLPRVVDLIDALSLNMQRRAAHDRGWARWAARIDAQRLQQYEHQICENVAAALVVAPADRDAIGPYPSIVVNPNGVDVSAFPYVPALGASRDRKRLVFTGNLGYFPNVDAVCWLADHVMPHVWHDEPETRLTIAGARPHRRIHALAKRDARIEVHGDVDRVHPWIAGARVSVAPMRAGSGQLLKVLEAMASGTPVVTTGRGLSGIEATPGEQLLVADDPAAFAAHVVNVLRDDRLAARLGLSGRQLVERLYTWERSVADLERVYERVLARHDVNAAVSCA
jgi:sugar transferase (PEP-CTERM/EpsH1 system associated)